MANLVMQDRMALMPLQTGDAILPLALAFTVASQLTARWTTRHGMRVLLWGCPEQLTELAAFGLVSARPIGAVLALRWPFSAW